MITKMVLILGSIILVAILSADTRLTLASRGKAQIPIIIQPEASEPERYAATELAQHLQLITGAKFEIKEISPGEVPEAGIIIGPGKLTDNLFPEVKGFLARDSSAFGGEQLIIRTKNRYLLLAGGRPRGTLYAVYRFLSKVCGIRWWTPWVSHIPKKNTLVITSLSIQEKPSFEYREPFWYPAFDGNWAVRNYYNGHRARLTSRHGGKITYKGFAHTFYQLVPPGEYFEKHPEWFSFRDGKRRWEWSQLCCTNPELRDFLTERVRQWLKESPEANIISISQNDWFGNCQCPDCRDLDEKEGSPAASVLDMVNDIAGRLGSEFPHIALDTFAYTYTRKPPKTIKPLPNVIVRLCSIECNFAQPLEHESNKSFAEDIRGWSRLTNRLYIWDYVTNFWNYVQPHPNWFSLGPNLRFFHKNGVLGVFEQGDSESNGADFAELKAWVLAQLLWNPYQDDRKLIEEFLTGYYGEAAPYIKQYMELMHNESKDCYLTYGPLLTPFFNFETLSKAEKLWQQAEKAVKDDAEIYWRVHQTHMPVWYAFLKNWAKLRIECTKKDAEWPLPLSRKQVAEEWLKVVTGPGPQGWTPVTHLNEQLLTPQKFVESLGEDEPELEHLLKSIPKEISFPKDIPGLDPKKCIDIQDDDILLYREGELGFRRVDSHASDYRVIMLPGWHREGVCQIRCQFLPQKAQKGKWKVYAVIKVEQKPETAPEKEAIQAGVYHPIQGKAVAKISIPIKDTSEDYKSYLIGA
ncbi:MAG: DUF4838 domain-containing protein, partial [Candidatus Omnitrophica bacterium]|nr:DUF4838 domain-containing protein [Candidatus Omnitrophota bacterium]